MLLRISILVCLLLAGVVCDAQAASPEPPITASTAVAPLKIYGCTLTENWDKFPDPSGSPVTKGKMEPTYEGDPDNWWQQLDGRFTIYVNWFNDGASPSFDPSVTPPPPDQIDPPQPITNFLTLETLTQLEVTAIDFDTKELYYGCPAGSEMEAPLLGSTPILSTGEIDIKDIHGSTMEGMRMILEGEFPNFEGPQSVMVVLQWDHPATYREATTELFVDAMPSEVVNLQTTVEFDSGLGLPPISTVALESCLRS